MTEVGNEQSMMQYYSNACETDGANGNVLGDVDLIIHVF